MDETVGLSNGCLGCWCEAMASILEFGGRCWCAKNNGIMEIAVLISTNISLIRINQLKRFVWLREKSSKIRRYRFEAFSTGGPGWIGRRSMGCRLAKTTLQFMRVECLMMNFYFMFHDHPELMPLHSARHHVWFTLSLFVHRSPNKTCFACPQAVIILSWGRRIPGLAGFCALHCCSGAIVKPCRHWSSLISNVRRSCDASFSNEHFSLNICLYGCRIARQNYYCGFLVRKNLCTISNLQQKCAWNIMLCGNAIPIIQAEVPTVRLYAHTSISRTQSLYRFLSRPQHQGPGVDLPSWDGHRFGLVAKETQGRLFRVNENEWDLGRSSVLKCLDLVKQMVATCF